MNIVNNDLLNFLAGVDVAFLMVDNELRLRRFSGAAERIVAVRAADVGHSLSHLESRFDLAKIYPLVRKAVDNLAIEQLKLQDRDGRWFSVTVRPYHTVDDCIGGAVIVFVVIDPPKQVVRVAEQPRDYAEGMLETVREPLVVLDRDLRVQRATTSFYDTFRVTRNETEGRLLYDLGNGQWNLPRLRELLGLALFRDEPFQDFEVQHDFPYLGHRTMRLNARRIPTADPEQRIVLLAIEDVTERREEAEIRYQRLFQSAKDGMLVFDAETGTLTDVNPYFLELTGFGREQLIGRHIGEIDCFARVKIGGDIVEQARLLDVVRRDTSITTEDGGSIEVEMVANRYPVGSQEVVQVNVRDVRRRNEAIRDLRRSEERFRLFVDSVRDYALFQTDPQGLIVSWNSGAERLLGYTESEVIGQPAAMVFTPEDIANNVPVIEMETAQQKGWAEDERWHMRKDGSRFFASGVLRTVYDEEGRLRGYAKVMRDVTERKQAAEQQRRQAQLLELAQDIIIVCDLEGVITFWNNAAAERYGWSKEEAIGRNVHALLETVFPEPLQKVRSTLLTEGHWEGELVHSRRDRSWLTVWSRWALQQSSEGTPDCVLQINTDITERKHADQNIRRSLREKEVLLKEVHHRVKNNLQIISSLLNLQANYLDEAKTRAILEDMNTRVRSIAAIHEMLYGSADLARVDFARYLETLARDLMSVYADRASGVRVKVTSGPAQLAITQAVPCGLMVNELLTNSFKHAFPNNRPGFIDVLFQCTDENCVLEVADDGVGLPSGLQISEVQSLGLQLLTLLTQQLKGTLEVIRSPGTRFIVRFPRIS